MRRNERSGAAATALEGVAEMADGAEFRTTCPEPTTEEEDKKERLNWLTAQLEAGFEEWHGLKKKGLEVALYYGSLLLEWRELAGHGSWQQEVREKVKGADIRTCNRWKRIAEHREEVEDALARWPEVRWGLVRMLDYISGRFDPDQPQGYEEDDGEYAPAEVEVGGKPGGGMPTVGVEKSTASAGAGSEAGLAGGLDGAGQAGEQEECQEDRPGTPAAPAEGASTQPDQGQSEPTVRPAAKRNEFEVEVRLGFKLSVPDHVAAQDVSEAIRFAERWTVGINTPFEFELSEKGVVVSLVRPWDNLHPSQPVVPNEDGATNGEYSKAGGA